ncbi:DUF2927 domain-containing protein [Cognatishimia maritima]|uniref:DUF2927 domain-containing protein n=1 Tax=Cognatishimia maritima TaxID=870908 RepID=UPI001F617AEE|nr:DUF2927 domain-containing protein [Cognatishimia maritima]
MACTAPRPDAAHPTRAVVADTTLPPVRAFTQPAPVLPSRANTDITRDFLDLSFALESGRPLPVLTRFETPITVKLQGRSTPILRNDLARLLMRLRNEAAIDIRQVTQGPANIIIQTVAKDDIRRALPHAACFVVPNVDSLSAYRRARGTVRTDWAQLQKREKLAIFLPYDTSPQDMRDCLHEELAQALGPLNDLYRLEDSVFNDDNFHAVLTSFDMLILRATYDPALQNGMSREQVGARLPTILAQINPDGEHGRTAPRSRTDREWMNAIQVSVGPDTTNARRLAAAEKALSIAQSRGWSDQRRGFSHFILARALQNRDPHLAIRHFRLADQYFQASVPDGPHRAAVAGQLAAYALAQGDAQEALRLADSQIGNATTYQNAIHLASLLMLKSEALAALGQTAAAELARLDSLGWARYGFGPEWIVRAKQREIALLYPKNRTN